MKSPAPSPEPVFIDVGPWKAHRQSGELIGPGNTLTLEPKVRDLLFLLAARRGEVVTREEIMSRLWPRVIVSEDSLARCVFKLRKALGDEARSPRYIETLSKRGYRLAREAALPAKPRLHWKFTAVAAVCVALVGIAYGTLHHSAAPESTALLDRADDFYHQMNQAQNEAAIEIYQRLVDGDKLLAGAYAGLANAYSQRAIRWPRGVQTLHAYTTLGAALQGGEMRAGYAAEQLRRAQWFAQKAIELAPRDARGYKALGLVLSARGDFGGALASLQRAMMLDPDAWEPRIDAGDVLEISGHGRDALPYFEDAFAAMTRQREERSTRIMPWYAATAVLVGDRHEKFGNISAAQQWYRRALDYAPLDVDATRRLASLLIRSGDRSGATQMCEQLRQRVDGQAVCAVTAPL